eukprot:COSAG02_NODE_53279_length_302_cov_90.182266_1_plen_100_part_11
MRYYTYRDVNRRHGAGHLSRIRETYRTVDGDALRVLKKNAAGGAGAVGQYEAVGVGNITTMKWPPRRRQCDLEPVGCQIVWLLLMMSIALHVVRCCVYDS